MKRNEEERKRVRRIKGKRVGKKKSQKNQGETSRKEKSQKNQGKTRWEQTEPGDLKINDKEQG